MSATIRADLAAAANAVLDPEQPNPALRKRCSRYYRQATRPGDAWVSFARRDRDSTGFGFMDSWEIRVVLPQDLEAAEKWCDEKADDLADALAPHLTITAVVMVTLVTDTGNIPGLIVEGVRPHEKEEN